MMYQFYNDKLENSNTTKQRKVALKNRHKLFKKHEYIKKWLRTYLEISTVHGVNHLVRYGRHFLEKCLWVMALLAMAYPTYLLCMFAWDHYNLNPSVVSIERDSRSWPSRIPTMTICQTQVQMRKDPEESDDDEEELEQTDTQFDNDTQTENPTAEHLSRRKRYTIEFRDNAEEDNSTLADCREKEDGPRRAYIPHKLRRHFKAILGGHFNNLEMEAFLNLIVLGNFSSYSELSRFQGTVYDTGFSTDLYIKWASAIAEPQEEPTPAGHRNETVLTEFGPCKMFNSDIGRYSTREFWEQGTYDDEVENQIIWLPALSTLILHKERMNAFKVFFHSPNDLIDLDSKHLTIDIDTFIQLEVRIENIWTTAEVGQLAIQQRHCRHSNESNLRHSPEIYSYKLCKMECRIELSIKFCNCTPYYYRKLDGEKTCNVTGLICLSKYAAEITSLEENGQSICTCIQNCDFVNARASQGSVEDWIMKSSIETTFYNTQNIRYKRTLIYTQMDLLVQAGGIAGLCYGIGFLTIVELLYHITIRLLLVFWRK